MFTADPDITADVADLFNFVTGFGRPTKFRKILVAPFTLRKGLVQNIRAVADAAAAGDHARIRIKVNNLTDPSDRRRAVQGIAGRRGDRPDRAGGLHAPTRSPRPERPDPRALDPRAASSSTAGSTASRPETTKTYLMGSADLMAAEPRPPDRGRSFRSRPPHVRTEIESIFKALLADNAQAWELARTVRGQRSQPRKASGDGLRRRCSCAVANAPAGSPGAAERR